MAKLALVALAFAAIVAFGQVSAYKTTITTTTTEDNGVLGFAQGLDNYGRGSSQECRRQIQGQQLSHCQMHITQGQGRSLVENPRQQQHLQLCCNQLRQVEEECQCEAIQKVVQQTLQQQQQQGGGRRAGTQGRQQQQQQMLEQILRKAQMIPNQCNLEIQQYCQIPIRIPN